MGLLAEAARFVSSGPHVKAPARVWVCGAALEEHRLLPAPPTSPGARQLVSCGRPAEAEAQAEGAEIHWPDEAGVRSDCPSGRG